MGFITIWENFWGQIQMNRFTCIFMSVVLAGCQTTGSIVGAGLGAASGIALTRGEDRTTQIIAGAAGAALGAFIGGEIGRRLDENDRREAADATRQALEKPIAPSQIESKPIQEPTTTQPDNNDPAPTSEPKQKPRSDQYTDYAAERRQRRVTSQPVEWTSTTKPSEVRGESQVIAASDVGTSNECRTIREVAFIRGQEVVQNTQYCKSGNQWAIA